MKINEIRSRKTVDKWYIVNDGTRSLFESAVAPEVEMALKDWKRAQVKDCVLVGGMAISFWSLPRHTQDADFLFLSADKIPSEVTGFKKTRAHAFRHNVTHVEIEVLDPGFLDVSPELVKKIYDDAKETDGIRVASKSGLVASKLKRFSRQDQADIENLIKLGGVDLTNWPLTDLQKKNYESIVNDLR